MKPTKRSNVFGKKLAKRVYGRLSPEYEENVSNIITIQIVFEEDSNTIDMYWGGDITPIQLGVLCAGFDNGDLARGLVNYTINSLESNPNQDEAQVDLELFASSFDTTMKLSKQVDPSFIEPPVVTPLEGIHRLTNMYADVEGE